MSDEKCRSRKWKALIWGIIVPQWFALFGAFGLAFAYRIEMGFNFALVILATTLLGVLGYCGINVWQKKIENGGKPNG